MVLKALTILTVALMVTGVFEQALCVRRYSIFKKVNWDRNELGDNNVRFDSKIDDAGILDKLDYRREKVPTCKPDEIVEGMSYVKKGK